ncbi:uncharacterized protein K460DRAFT_352406 [Cucurbitaria berberidis CBS 394.84]|uniref:Uncharacterized protein n=1 Tax=Cucurbitaria berberidis CBS 394.84 TaxID=1168544 RepID=A0A9P4GJ94_9PLEO|nr:uncharacterized protein K460DRAFT_352406 [Cucurbitaria berberidis CBS 394.84]KAF1847243.1 hypothetical protein K460DRAFT_352406 [Cucurbitaria berberidis CBS 394.84]
MASPRARRKLAKGQSNRRFRDVSAPYASPTIRPRSSKKTNINQHTNSRNVARGRGLQVNGVDDHTQNGKTVNKGVNYQFFGSGTFWRELLLQRPNPPQRDDRLVYTATRDESPDSPMSISDMLRKFSLRTRKIINKLKQILLTIRTHQRDASELIKGAFMDEELEDLLLWSIDRRKSTAILSPQDLLVFGNALELIQKGERTSREPVEHLLETLEGARKQSETMSIELRKILLPKLGFLNEENRIRCIDMIEGAGNCLMDFQTHMNNYYKSLLLAESPSQQPYSLKPAEVKELEELAACRIASAILCQQLCRLCDDHTTHQVYINLDEVKSIPEDERQRLRFHLAFTKSGENDDDLVWIQADSMIDVTTASKTSNVVDAPIEPGQMVERPMFCVASLETGMNFRFRIGTSIHVQQLPRWGGSYPIALSDWIMQPYLRPLIRFRVARLIAEAVLKFDATIWDLTSLKSRNIMLLIPHKGLKTHLGICLQEQKAILKSEPSSYRSDEVHRSQEILYNLGVILLELALMEHLPEGYSEEHIKERCNEDVVQEMGNEYATVIRFCLQFKRGDVQGSGSIYDKSMQEYFYQRVIRLLKLGEEPLQRYERKPSE